MKIALAQTNPKIGDLENNFQKIVKFVENAKLQKADLIIFPELTVCGYPPLDLLEKSKFIKDNIEYIEKVKKLSKEIGILYGTITYENDNIGTNIFNSAIFFHNEKILNIHNKTLLPNYDVFDEVRYFESAKEIKITEFKNIKFGISICEDAWNDKDFWRHRFYSEDPIEKINSLSPDILVNISASPFCIGKESIRQKMFSSISKKYNKPLLQINQVGANTDLIFDGASKVFNSSGEMVLRLKKFEEDLQIIDTNEISNKFDFSDNENKDIIDAIVLGIKDYFNKSGFKKAILGLSGGIDSALVCTLATMALGKQNVFCLLMPSPYSSRGSIDDSLKLINNLGVGYKIIPISEIFSITKNELNFSSLKEDIAEENIQARLRGLLLMAYSNKFGYLLLSTGNKSETAVGYATLYGDMCGGLAVISDVYKTKVWELSRYLNSEHEIIPNEISNKVPSAELRFNQTDQDSLPPYEILDKILFNYIENSLEAEEIIKKGFNPDIVNKVLNLVDKNEYKRRQAAPGLKISNKAFGLGRRYPIIQGWR